MALYEKSVRRLMRDMIAALGLSSGKVFTKDEAVDWFREKYPLVKESTIVAHLVQAATW